MPKVCPMDGTSKRESMKQMIFTLQKDGNRTYLRYVLFGSFGNNKYTFTVTKFKIKIIYY